MIVVDRLLAQRASADRPLRIAMVGAGFMARGIANQIINSVPGMELVAIANRTVERAEAVYREAGIEEPAHVESRVALEAAIDAGTAAITEDPLLLCEAGPIDAIVEVTGTVEYALRVVLAAFENGKHVILMNAELDGTIGPILKQRADRAGVILTASEGDQPGVQMNLYRNVRGMGLRPLLIGNIKGLHDPYRTPTTQQGFAEKWGQNPWMVTSFADGTKISFEQAIVANATGFRVAQRGMLGRDHRGHVDELTSLFDIDELERYGGIVDYVVGAQPSPGVFVLATHDDPKQRHYLNLYKLGEGPLYSFYTPYHLCHFEVPSSIARAVLLGDAVMAPAGGPRVEVVATAKKDLKRGETLDALGGYTTYGQCENIDVALAESLLPIGLAEGCTLRVDVDQDTVLTYSDVELPADRQADGLRSEQIDHFFGSAG